MRERLAREIPGRSPWDLKFTAGGLVDIEFIAQTLVLCSAQTGADVLDPNTIETLRKLSSASVLAADDAAILLDAASLQQVLTQVLRLTLDVTLDPMKATSGLKSLLVRAASAESFDALERRLAAAQAAVRDVFARTLG